MLKDMLQALKMLKQIENPSQEAKNALEILEQSIKAHTKQNLLDLMTIGDITGYDELHNSLIEMIKFVEKMQAQKTENK